MPFVLRGLCKTENALTTEEAQKPDSGTSGGLLVISYWGGHIMYLINMQKLLEQLYNALKKQQDDGKNKKYLVQIAPLVENGIATIQKACDKIRHTEFMDLPARQRITFYDVNKDCLEQIAQLIKNGIAAVRDFEEEIRDDNLICIANTVVTMFINANRQVSFVF